MLKLQVIVGSTRPTRAADQVADWVLAAAADHGALEPELLDLREWPLPMFSEHAGTIGDFADPSYSEPAVRHWNKKIAEGDAYLMITPEYNHSIPGVLKNAIDSVWLSFAFRNKPLGVVSYSGGTTGGARAVEHLAQIAVEMEMAPMKSSVTVPNVASAFTDGAPQAADHVMQARLGVLLDDLAWWGDALAAARSRGQLEPAMLRVRAAVAA